MFVHSSRRLGLQRGASLLGMATMAVVVGAIMLLGVRIFPAINEYLTVRKTVNQIMRGNPTSAAEVRAAFERATEVEYSIHTIDAKDLQVDNIDGRLRTSYAYKVEIPLIEPVYLLFKFDGSAMSGGGL